jgi:tRNA pseudouridine38-40 synthase
LRRALELLPGRRDWSGFAGAACTVDNRVRDLRRAEYEEVEADESGWFTFAADGFLTYMVRNLVGTLLEIGRGRFAPERIGRVLESGDRTLAGPTAAARGLVLWRVDYLEREVRGRK